MTSRKSPKKHHPDGDSRSEKRVFFGIEVLSPWPETLPQGRIIPPESRHATLAFLGECDFDLLSLQLLSVPLPQSKMGFGGVFHQCLFLPPRSPRVVAWEINFLQRQTELARYQYRLEEWLRDNGYLDESESRSWLPHVTLCRSPFTADNWQKEFEPLPLIATNIHLYESVGGLSYKPLWSYPLIPPFKIEVVEGGWRVEVYAEKKEQLPLHSLLSFAFLEPFVTSEIKLQQLTSLRETAAFIQKWLKERLKKDNPTVTELTRFSELEENRWELMMKN